MRSFLLRPARPAVAAFVAAFCLAAAPAHAQDTGCSGANDVPTPATMASAKSATLCLLNGQRAAAGLKPLRVNAGLERVSDNYSAAMIVQHVFEHVLPDGVDLTGRLAAYTDPADSWTVGENIGYGESTQATPMAMVIAWMHSPGHRANILNGDFQEIGVGIVNGTPVGTGPNSATYTTDFGAREMPAAAPAKASTAAATRYVTPRRCTRSALARLSKGSRRARVATCTHLRRAALRRAALRRAALRRAGTAIAR
jgi:uncharacterized protein YkwD